MGYILGTGYYNGGGGGLDWFARVWLENTILFADPLPERIVVVSVGDSRPPYPPTAAEGLVRIDTLDLTGNPGHVHQLNGMALPRKPYHYSGVMATFMTLCSIAYANECDLVYKEQDCLVFGAWVNRLYDDLDQGGMIFGRCKILESAQSLFLMRHHFIPTFMSYMLMCGSEQDTANLPEHKFTRLAQQMPDQAKYFDFGYDRDRPLNIDDPVWCAQKFTPDELRQLVAARLINADNIPEGVALFTNTI